MIFILIIFIRNPAHAGFFYAVYFDCRIINLVSIKYRTSINEKAFGNNISTV